MFEATCDAKFMNPPNALTSCLGNVGRPCWLRILCHFLRKVLCGLAVMLLSQIRGVWLRAGARQLPLQDPDWSTRLSRYPFSPVGSHPSDDWQ
jgi:hypothetical protein